MAFSPFFRSGFSASLVVTLGLAPVSCQTQRVRTERRDASNEGKNGQKNPVNPKQGTSSEDPPHGHTVMIIDDGFDVTHEVFKSKIVGQFTVRCSDDTESPLESSLNNLSLDQAKNFLKQRYLAPTAACKISDGIQFNRPANFAQIETYRDKWNEGLKKKIGTLDSSTIETVSKIVGGAGNFHGTNTSGLIGYQNPHVKMVLVQMELGGPNSPGRRVLCPTQRGINTWVEAHRDAEVRKAYIEGPADTLESSLDAAVKKHQVTLVNMSFGREPRALREKTIADAGCGRVDYAQFYQLTNELERARANFQHTKGPAKDLPKPLAVQAAGNDGLQVDTISDSFECSNPTGNLLIAGSVDLSGKKSKFSNFGGCVDYYILGSKVVVAAPDNFLSVANGTSFSAPLLVRYISKEFPASDEASAIIQKLRGKADATGRLGDGAAPQELSYEDDKASIGAYALTESPQAPVRRYLPINFRWGLGGFR